MRDEYQEDSTRSSGPSHSSSGAGTALIAIAVGLVFIVAPIAFSDYVGGLSQTLLIGFGLMLLLTGSIVVIITRLYVKTTANRAFVRTGMGGSKAIIDGGALVIPVIHSMTWVNLETIKLDVERTGLNSLICGNKLRADVVARFFIRVAKEATCVISAATSLGNRTLNTDELLRKVGDKLESALRDVATTRTLSELNTKRAEFSSAVQEIVSKELEPNGLKLESVTITKLDQTDPTHLRPETNVFDAEGAKTIAEITQAARIARNEIERNADKKVKEQDTSRDQFVYLQEVTRATAEATTNAEKKKAAAKADQEAASFQADQTRQSGLARVESEKEVALAEVERLRAADVAERERQKSVGVAEVERARAADLAERERQIAVANAEKERAAAEAAKLAAENEREVAAQAVQTTQAKAQAERARDVAIVAKESTARQNAIEKNTEADIAAYKTVKEADAAQEAAEKNATAITTKATADRAAKVLEAEGTKAVQLVPVEVNREQTTVDRQRLEQQQQFGRVAIDLQIALARIEADKEVRIEAARALGIAMASAKMTIWGDPSTAKRMTDAFLNGQGIGAYAQGLLNASPDEIKALMATLGSTGVALLKRATGIDLAAPNGVDGPVTTVVAESRVN